eukprot:GHVR01119826.1.p2 GENE.GHVR01119826.1~~GHVR01119826.1.p2  ORF type:complete len:125 (+),score=45.87 GHVR01119826.1:69-443(+)
MSVGVSTPNILCTLECVCVCVCVFLQIQLIFLWVIEGAYTHTCDAHTCDAHTCDEHILDGHTHNNGSVCTAISTMSTDLSHPLSSPTPTPIVCVSIFLLPQRRQTLSICPSVHWCSLYCRGGGV